MAQEPIEMPASLRRRPTYKNLPIPFITPIGPDGRPIFAVNNVLLKTELMEQRRCAMCGEAMGEWVAFIDSEPTCKTRVFPEPPMHLDCARYATQVCPFLTNPDYGQTSRRPIARAPGTVMINQEVPTAERNPTERMGIYIASGYEIIRVGPTVAARATPPKQIRWFYYPER